MFQRTLEVQREDQVDPKEMQMWHLLGFLQCHGELSFVWDSDIQQKHQLGYEYDCGGRYGQAICVHICQETMWTPHGLESTLLITKLQS